MEVEIFSFIVGMGLGALFMHLFMTQVFEPRYFWEDPPEVAYVCDRRSSCASSEGCGIDCRHTKNILHAKNFKCVGDYKWIENEEKKEKEND